MRRNTMVRTGGAIALLIATGIAGGATGGAIPARPGDLVFPPLHFDPPNAADYRLELPGGVPVYLAPSHEFPLVTITFSFRGGAYLEPPGETGLATALGNLLRRGGTTTLAPDEVDEKLDFLAANVTTAVGPEQSRASLDCLESSLDEAFTIFMDLLRNPRFDTERLRIHTEQVIEQLKQRNDAPTSVAMLQLGPLVYGPHHYAGRQPTLASIQAITPERLRVLHGRIFHPGNLFIAVTGDFDPDAMLDRLSAATGDWPRGEPAGDPPPPTKTIAPGLYHAAVDQKDLPQGTEMIVTRGVRRDDPQAIAFTMMNQILGGGGFTSRITRRVRSDEGLAYVAASFLRPEVYYPGLFSAFFQSKNRTVAYATKIIMEEINRIRSEPVTAEELETAKNGFIERFPQRFASKRAMLGVFIDDEITRREPAYWREYRDHVRAVSAADVQRVARAYLDPQKMLILVVGDWDEIYGGDLEGRATMNDFFQGNVTHLPTLDPLTLEPKE